MKAAAILRPLALATALLTLSACGDDDPSGPSADQGPTFDLTLTATQLVVQQDCDAMTGSASAAAGDFFIRVEMRRVVDGSPTVIASTDYQLIQANDGETVTVGFSANGSFQASPGARLELDVSIYENDTSGRQFDETDTTTLEYDAGRGCWVYAGDSTCLGGTGGILSTIMRIRNVPGDPCALDLRWTLDGTEQ